MIQLLEENFPELVESSFTAHMETCLDAIAHGTEDKLSFLSNFYLGNEKELGLLHKVEQKVELQQLDHRESRILRLPELKDLGHLKLGSSGIYLESLCKEDSVSSPENSTDLEALSSSSSSLSSEMKALRWVLPLEMQQDIRKISRDALITIMRTEADTSGFQKGIDPSSNKPVAIKLGRFGKYAQIGIDSDEEKKLISLPSWVDGTATLEDVLEFSSLPMTICPYPLLNSTIIIEVASKNLSVGVKGFPLRVPLPPGVVPSQVTEDMCWEILPSEQEIQASNRVLGVWEGLEVSIRNGFYGYYVKCGTIVAGSILDFLPLTVLHNKKRTLFCVMVRAWKT